MICVILVEIIFYKYIYNFFLITPFEIYINNTFVLSESRNDNTNSLVICIYSRIIIIYNV